MQRALFTTVSLILDTDVDTLLCCDALTVLHV